MCIRQQNLVPWLQPPNGKEHIVTFLIAFTQDSEHTRCIRLQLWIKVNNYFLKFMFLSLDFVCCILVSYFFSFALLVHHSYFFWSLDSRSLKVVSGYAIVGCWFLSLFFETANPSIYIHLLKSKFVFITFCDFQFSPHLSNLLLSWCFQPTSAHNFLKILSRFRTWSVKVGKCEALEYVWLTKIKLYFASTHQKITKYCLLIFHPNHYEFLFAQKKMNFNEFL